MKSLNQRLCSSRHRTARIAVMMGGLSLLHVCHAIGQTTKPDERMTHRLLLERCMREPLSVVAKLTPEGDPLSEDQQKRFEKASKLLKDVENYRKNAKFADAAHSAGEAAEEFKLILGQEHHISVSAQITKQTMDDYANAATEAQEELAVTDKEMAKAQDLFDRGLFAESEVAAMRALAGREKILGVRHPDIVDALRIIGASRLELQAFDKADEALSQAVQLSERTFGRNHPKTAALLDRHGWMKINQGRATEAAKLLAEALRIYKKAVGDTPELAETMDNLGTSALITGEPEDALKLKLRALVIREKILGHKAKDTAVSLSNLAWLYGRVGMIDEVIPLREEALKIFRETVGPDHTYAKMELTNLCKSYEDRGEFGKATALYREQIARDEKHADQVDISAVQRCIGLGAILIRQGQLSEGKKYLEKALARGRELLNTTARQPAISEIEKVAEVYSVNRMIRPAMALYEELRALDEKQSMPTDPTVRRGEQLASTYILLGRNKEAIGLLKKVIADGEKVYGKGERLTATALVTYCEALTQLGELEEAEHVGDEVLKICDTKMPDRNLQGRSVATAHTLLRMGHIYTKQKRFDVARFTLEDALGIFRKDGRDYLGIIDCQLAIVDCFGAAGQNDKAESALKEAVAEARKFVAGARSPYTDAALARALHRQLDSGSLSGDAKANGQKELKIILIRLRDADALDAENEKWLGELDSAGH